jgi:hypothetical protein
VMLRARAKLPPAARPRNLPRGSYTVGIMEFSGDKVARETQSFVDPFEASAWRAQWVQRMDT